jgi:hypothetical protein
MLKSIPKKNLVQKFNCPWCGQRLWRLGSPQQQPRTPVRFEPPHLAAKNRASGLTEEERNVGQLDIWREEFFCEAHGLMWIELSQQADGSLIAGSYSSCSVTIDKP